MDTLAVKVDGTGSSAPPVIDEYGIDTVTVSRLPAAPPTLL